jgi:nucleoside-diphosphate-sugar epimerase
MVRVFLTGGSGYLGSTLLSPVPRGWEVVAFGRRPPSIPAQPGVRFVQGDLTAQEWNPDAVKGCDVILHLAGLKGQGSCAARPLDAVELNVVGTHRLIRAGLEHGVRRFVLASSYWVYGERNEPPYREEMRVAPDELYGLTKAVSEMELAGSGLDYTILRFANLFGQGTGRGREEVIFHFITNALRGDPLYLDGGGLQELDFLGVRDAARAIALLATDPRASRQVFNLGSGNPVSIAELASGISRLARELYGREAAIGRRSPADTRPARRFVSMEKFRGTFPELVFPPLDKALREYMEVREAELHGPGR